MLVVHFYSKKANVFKKIPSESFIWMGRALSIMTSPELMAFYQGRYICRNNFDGIYHSLWATFPSNPTLRRPGRNALGATIGLTPSVGFATSSSYPEGNFVGNKLLDGLVFRPFGLLSNSF